MQRVLSTQQQVPERDPVEKIYINLAIDTDPEYYQKFGRRMIPSYNALQTALDLYQDSRLDLEHLIRVGRDLSTNYGFTIDELQSALDDMIRRQVIGDQTFQKIFEPMASHGLINQDYVPSVPPAKLIVEGDGTAEVSGIHEPWVPDRIDYFHDYR
jgi:hypothetical protein